MADFVRIWDEDTQEYVEYDVALTGEQIVPIPVIPVEIATQVSITEVNKIIDTTDITSGAETVIEVSTETPKQINVESSVDSNMITLSTPSATQLNVIATVNETVITQTTAGVQGV